MIVSPVSLVKVGTPSCELDSFSSNAIFDFSSSSFFSRSSISLCKASASLKFFFLIASSIIDLTSFSLASSSSIEGSVGLSFSSSSSSV